MYNRYVPGNNGAYERQTLPDPQRHGSSSVPPHDCREETKTEQQQARICQKSFFGFDLGDLLLLCIVILLLIDSDEDDMFPILIMAAAFLLQQ